MIPITRIEAQRLLRTAVLCGAASILTAAPAVAQACSASGGEATAASAGGTTTAGAGFGVFRGGGIGSGNAFLMQAALQQQAQQQAYQQQALMQQAFVYRQMLARQQAALQQQAAQRAQRTKLATAAREKYVAERTARKTSPAAQFVRTSGDGPGGAASSRTGELGAGYQDAVARFWTGRAAVRGGIDTST